MGTDDELLSPGIEAVPRVEPLNHGAKCSQILALIQLICPLVLSFQEISTSRFPTLIF